MANLEDLINKYRNAEEILRMCVIETLEETGVKIVANAKLNTPVKTGNLRRSIHCTDVNTNDNTYTMDITTEGRGVEQYASKIENGFTGSKGGHYAGKHMIGNAVDSEMNNFAATFKNKVGEYFNDQNR